TLGRRTLRLSFEVDEEEGSVGPSEDLSEMKVSMHDGLRGPEGRIEPAKDLLDVPPAVEQEFAGLCGETRLPRIGALRQDHEATEGFPQVRDRPAPRGGCILRAEALRLPRTRMPIEQRLVQRGRRVPEEPCDLQARPLEVRCGRREPARQLP